MKSIIRAFTLLPGWKKLLFGVLVVGILQSAVTVAVPLAIQRIIDNLISSLSQDNVSTQVFITPLLVWLGLRVGLSLVVWLGEIVSDNAFTKSIISFREQTVRRLEKLPVSFYESRRAGQLTAEVNQSPHLFGRWIQDVCENYLTTILQALFAIGVLGYKFLPIAVVVLILAVISSSTSSALRLSIWHVPAASWPPPP